MGKPILHGCGALVTMLETDLTGSVSDFTGMWHISYHDIQAISQLQPDSERDISQEIYQPNFLSTLQLTVFFSQDRGAGEGCQERGYIDLQPSPIVWRVSDLFFYGGLISAFDNTCGQ